MATREPVALRWLATEWENAIDNAERRDDAATFAGIVGDAQHRLEGGYHISREDQPSSNYSVADCPEDREGPSDLAAAVDISMRTADMILVTGRLHSSWQDPNDHRLDHVRGINGTLDGVNAIRFDCQFGTLNEASDDHLWHVHLEVLRKYVEDMDTMRAILSVITGGGGGLFMALTDQQQQDMYTMVARVYNNWDGPKADNPQAQDPVRDRVGGNGNEMSWRDQQKRMDKLQETVDAMKATGGVTPQQLSDAFLDALRRYFATPK